MLQVSSQKRTEDYIKEVECKEGELLSAVRSSAVVPVVLVWPSHAAANSTIERTALCARKFCYFSCFVTDTEHRSEFARDC